MLRRHEARDAATPSSASPVHAWEPVVCAGPGGCSNRFRPCRLPPLAGPKRRAAHIIRGARADQGDDGTTMTEIRYLAPGTLDEAIKAFAASARAARIL